VIIGRRQLLGNLLAAGVSTAASRSAWAGAGAPPVFVLLRGGLDGLSVAVPFESRFYRELRPSVRVEPEPSLRLNADSALHPALARLFPLFTQKELIVVRGVRASRSQMHGEAEAELRRTLSDLHGEPRTASLSDARSLRGELAASSSCFLLESEGWDTHVAQGAARGLLADRLAELAQDLTALWASLSATGSARRVVVLTELGRAAHENARSGTDHGEAFAMLVLGKGIGGRVVGEWRGFERGELRAGGGLHASLELRSVLSQLGETSCAR
jgi:uncharacterized protein (DUF1501 family)